MNTKRPVINLRPAKNDILLDVIAIAGLIFLWIYILMSYSQLPGIIPIHYNFSGKIDGYGSKTTIFILPAVITCLAILLTVLNRYPHAFNYPTTITEANARSQYTLATRLIRWVKLIIVVIAILLTASLIRDAHNRSAGWGWWTIPLFCTIITLPIFFYFYYSRKIKTQP